MFKINHERPHSVRQSRHFMGRIPAPAVSHLQSLHLECQQLCCGENWPQQLSPWMTLSKQTLLIFLALLSKINMWDYSICKVSFPLKYLVVNFEVLSSEKKGLICRSQKLKTMPDATQHVFPKESFYSSQFVASYA